MPNLCSCHPPWFLVAETLDDHQAPNHHIPDMDHYRSGIDRFARAAALV
jgi:hypothetical protein